MRRKNDVLRNRIVAVFDGFEAIYYEDMFFGDWCGNIEIRSDGREFIRATSAPLCKDEDEVVEAAKNLMALYLSFID